MISLTFMFWLFVLLFAIIGATRGWAKEILVTFAVILSLFLITIIEKFAPIITETVAHSGNSSAFWLRFIIIVGLVFFGYQSPNLPRLSESPKFVREHLQDTLLGLFLGVVNGFLIFGSIWYFLHQANYPISYIAAPIKGTEMGDAALKDDPLPCASLAGNSFGLFCHCFGVWLCHHYLLMKKHIHLIGIGGTGLSAIARLLQQSGYSVSGSDQMMSPLAEALIQEGIKVTIGHKAENVTGADVIVRSSAISDNNPEVLAGR